EAARIDHLNRRPFPWNRERRLAILSGEAHAGRKGGMVMGASDFEVKGPCFRQAVPKGLTRRSWLRFTAGGMIAAGTAPAPLAFGARGDEGDREGRLIVRSRRPLDLETPVSLLGDWLTPADLLFVRSHFGEPAVGLSPWTTQVQGLVD